MNKNEFISLSLAYIKPAHTYTLSKLVKSFELERWVSISKMTIYNTMKRLTLNGYLNEKIEKVVDAPDRKIYTITNEGIIYLEELLIELINSEFSTENNLAIAMMFAYNIEGNKLLDLLIKRIKYLNKEIDSLSINIDDAILHKNHVSLILCKSLVKQINIEIETINDWNELLIKNPNYFNKDLIEFYRELF